MKRDRGSLMVAIACLEEFEQMRRKRFELRKAPRGHGKFESAA